MEKRGLTLQGVTGLNFLYIITSFAMIAVSVYLTTHYYDTLFPTSIGGGKSLCDISNFFNCDTATYSPMAAFLKVPIAFLGAIMGLFFLSSSIFPSEGYEKTASLVSKINFIGCLVLFIYSITVLGSLCPFCTLYYVLSGIVCFLLWKHGHNSWQPQLKTAGIWLAITLVGAVLINRHTTSKEQTLTQMNSSVVEQFNSLANLGESEESPYKIHMSTEKFADAPIRISVFSDFECPFCKMVAEQMPELIRRYNGKINIQYFFYPLDSKCNPNMKNGMHRNACDAAMIAACDESKFAVVHDEIFANQDKIADAILSITNKHGLKNCLENAELKNKVAVSINAASKYNLRSTPTIIVNGRKIEGSIPNAQFSAIFDDLLKK
ncbi:MAG: thioredoxin domain-containing protein [Bacteriovoracaceae bacterium]